MRKLKTGLLAIALAAGACLFTGCGQVDETILETNADFSVNINVPYSTTTPLPDYLNVPDQVVIDANGGVTVNDPSLLNNSYTNVKANESQYTTLSLGDTNTSVQALQERLQALGYYSAGVSGIFDEETVAAVKRFEQTYGIMQTGIATPTFQAKLFSESAPIYGSEAYDSAVISQYTTLQRGAVGSSVYALQHRLKELGYPIKELSGVYDTATEKAVSLFGAAYGLKNQTVAYIALQKELYSDSARAYSADGSVVHQSSNSSLGLGNAGTSVMQVQNRLIALGYLDGSASGMFDAETDAAVREFEAACGVSPSGRLTTELQSILMSDDAPAYGTTYATAEKTYVDLYEGCEGEEVRLLQERLIELGYAAGAGNGIYGSETTSAVRLFERYNGMEETGRATAFVQSHMFSPSALSYQDILNGITYATPAPATPEPTEVPEGPEIDISGEVDPNTGLRTLTLDCAGDDVSSIQARLNELGYSCNSSGVYDESTASAMRLFQAAIGVSQTGDATPSMQQYIQTKAAPSSQYRLFNSTQSFTSLQEGDTGDNVTQLQQQLWKLGYLLTDDVQNSVGTFHDKTREAVISAQRAMGYADPDGVASIEFQCFIFSDYNYLIKK